MTESKQTAGERLQRAARDAAGALPGVSEGRPFVDSLDVYKVSDKVFLIVTDDPDNPIITVKCEPEYGAELQRGVLDAIEPARHLAVTGGEELPYDLLVVAVGATQQPGVARGRSVGGGRQPPGGAAGRERGGQRERRDGKRSVQDRSHNADDHPHDLPGDRGWFERVVRQRTHGHVRLLRRSVRRRLVPRRRSAQQPTDVR